MARLLVEYGARVEIKDGQGRTPLDYVSGEQRDEIIKLYRAKRENCYIM
jgi:ankyrin repeat protein